MTSKFSQYAAEASKRMFLGTLIKYAKGTWQMGTGKVSISPDKPFIAVMDTATTGHLKWADGKPVDSRMGLIADGFRPLHRNDLDDLDSKSWEVDEYGDRVDPWQKTTLVVLLSATAPHDIFTFTTGTVGGENAIADLCGAHGSTTEEVGQYPVVTLGTDSYEHKIKSRGRIDVPIFKIVDRVEAAPFNTMVAGARGGAIFIPASPAASRTGSIAIGSGKRAWNDNGEPPEPSPPESETPPPPKDYDGPGELDDQIPF
jgi:hypothetical protein